MPKILTPAALEDYRRDGYYAPVRVFDAEEAARYRSDLEGHEARTGAPLQGKWRVKSRERRRAASSGEGTPPAEKATTGSPRVLRGVVVSDKADKTITVRIDTARPHRTYGKIVRSSSTLHAHDESNDAGAGDTVRVVESRPLSRTKRWRLVEVVERAR